MTKQKQLQSIHKPLSIFMDADGDYSSKRIVGISAIALAFTMCIILFIYSIFKMPDDANTAIEVINSLMLLGGSLLGLGVVEGFSRKSPPPTDDE